MSNNIVKLTFCNFFTFFAFNRNDKRLSSRDQKIATVATVLFGFTFIGLGHAFCRLFLYKKITTPTGSTTEKTKKQSEKITPQKSSPKEESKTTTPETKHTSKHSSPSEKTPSKSDPASQAFVSCKYDLKEIMKTTNPGIVDVPDTFDRKAPFFNQRVEIFGSVFDTKVPAHAKGYDYFKGIKLVNWPHLSKQDQLFVCGTKDVEKNLSKLNQAINKRLDQFQKTFKFTECAQALKEKKHLNELTMADLEEAVLDSTFVLALVHMETFGDITLSKDNTNERQLKIIKLRMPHLDKVAVSTIPDIEKMNLREFHSLSGKQLSQIIDKLPLNWVELISEEQIKDMDFSKLSAKNVDHLATFETLFPLPTFTNPSRLNLLTLKQLYSCWDLLGEEQTAILSNTIIKQIDFKKYPFNEAQFKRRFCSYRHANDPVEERELSDIKLLSDNQVADCWQHFSDIHVSYLSDGQIQHLPLDAFKSGDEDRFSGLFYVPGFKVEEARRKMALLSADQLGAYWDLFGENIGLISKEQLQNLDPALPMSHYFKYIPDSKIQWLTSKQIVQYWDLFDAKRITHLSDSQLKRLDFTLFETDESSKELAEALFNPNSIKEVDEARRKFKMLDNAQTDILKRILSSEAYSAISR